MMKITIEEMLEAVKNAKPLTPEQKKELKKVGKKIKKLSLEELIEMMTEDNVDDF